MRSPGFARLMLGLEIMYTKDRRPFTYDSRQVAYLHSFVSQFAVLSFSHSLRALSGSYILLVSTLLILTITVFSLVRIVNHHYVLQYPQSFCRCASLCLRTRS